MYLLHLTLIVQLSVLSGADGSGIVGGKGAKKHSRPYMVSLQKNGHHVCGGMLIRQDFVLTSGHCLEYHPLRVVLGAHDITHNEKTQQKIEVKHYHRHPLHLKYHQTQYDIMLLELSRKANLTASVSTIKLYEDYIEAKTKCSVAGWGKIKTNRNTPAATLMEVVVEVEKSTVCMKAVKELQWQRYYNAKQMICARVNEGKGFCQGDSGGPLVCNKKALGIVAFNSPQNCQDPKSLDAYMKIPFFIPWIKSVMNGRMSPNIN